MPVNETTFDHACTQKVCAGNVVCLSVWTVCSVQSVLYNSPVDDSLTCCLRCVSGIAHLLFTSSNNHYTWRKVTTTVNNIIVGRLWVDNHGEMDIKNHTTGDNCHLKFFAYSYFSREPPRKVSLSVCLSVSLSLSVCLRVCLNDKFARYIHKVHPNKSPLKIWEKGSAGVSMDFPNF